MEHLECYVCVFEDYNTFYTAQPSREGVPGGLNRASGFPFPLENPYGGSFPVRLQMDRQGRVRRFECEMTVPAESFSSSIASGPPLWVWN